ncbi:DUF6327 family protein [Flavobacterium sp. N1994]|uniref:DUF6327 family protein n=1 Tax=Flavobacterium sp. N1994 TaxID=2986827 RepID=UPI0022238FDC|nr:DUF6327 family protein [Flavobacterium sp. N1994]
METKKYSSYAQIENDLEILKIEKEIHYQKIVLSIEKTKESLVPSKSISFVADIYNKYLSGTYGTILKILIPYAINWFINRKRGD